MRRSVLLGLIPFLLLANGASATESSTIDLDLCIGGSCKNGRIKSITVTPERFIIVIDPDLCAGIAHFCPSSYSAFVLDGDVRARVEGYEPGKKTADLFSVYVPRAYKTLYIEGVKKGGNVASVDLRPYERQAGAGAGAESGGEVSELTRWLDRDGEAEREVEALSEHHGLAVVFGIESYRYAPTATYAGNDAAVFRDYLLRHFGFEDDRILFRVDGQATGGEFSRAFSPRGWLDRRATPQSDLLVYFAGHGTVDPDSGRALLLPHDVDPEFPDSAYPLEQLLANLAGMQARSVTVVLDASFGGIARDERPLVAGQTGSAAGAARPDIPARTLVFVACAGGESNAVFDEKRHGLFTYFFLKGAAGEADGDADGRITAAELAGFLESTIPAHARGSGREQHPGLLGADGARIVFGY